MTEINNWQWVVDKDEMCCRNLENNVTVKMEKEGQILRGKIHDMPMELFGKIAEIENGEEIIMQIVKMAEENFFKNF
ncbi:MAG: hypothetical protein FWH19_05365 [Treponema sp.]|nr:hypothetical protein [Treponema sp.]